MVYVKKSSGFIQEDDIGLLGQGPGNGNSLFFPPAELGNSPIDKVETLVRLGFFHYSAGRIEIPFGAP